MRTLGATAGQLGRSASWWPPSLRNLCQGLGRPAGNHARFLCACRGPRSVRVPSGSKLLRAPGCYQPRTRPMPVSRGPLQLSLGPNHTGSSSVSSASRVSPLHSEPMRVGRPYAQLGLRACPRLSPAHPLRFLRVAAGTVPGCWNRVLEHLWTVPETPALWGRLASGVGDRSSAVARGRLLRPSRRG